MDLFDLIETALAVARRHGHRMEFESGRRERVAYVCATCGLHLLITPERQPAIGGAAFLLPCPEKEADDGAE